MGACLAAVCGYALACGALCGCATIFTGTHDTLSFGANVPGVRLTIDGKYLGDLPLKVDMSRNFIGGQQFMAKFEAEGYETQEFKLDRAFNGVAILDITSTPVSGGIDLLTGSLMMFSPCDYQVHMVNARGSTRSVEFQRGLAVYRFALINFSSIRRDIARGGGEYLTGLATLVGGGDPAAAARIAEASLRNRDLLVGTSEPRSFVESYREVIARSHDVHAYGL